MKYGERFAGESAPQWYLHNMDYNSLKHLIKVNTNRDGVAGVVIPGCVDEAAQNFEQEFYAELCRSYDGVCLFVSSKAGELDRRLTSLSSRANDLLDRYSSTSYLLLATKRELDKCSDEQRMCSHDIQSMERFINAQREAFRKILKKYRRWTGSPVLDTRFKTAVDYHPRNLSKCHVGRLQSRCDHILSDLRAAFPFLTLGFGDPIASSLIKVPATTPRTPRSKTYPLLLPGSTGYWNEYSHSSDVEDQFRTADECYLALVDPRGGNAAGVNSIFVNRCTSAEGGSGSSVASNTDQDVESSGRFCLSPYGTTTNASASASSFGRVVATEDETGQIINRSPAGSSSSESDSVSVASPDDELSLSGEDASPVFVRCIWFCLGGSLFLSVGILTPVIYTYGHTTTRNLGVIAWMASGLTVSLGAVCFALCAIISSWNSLREVANRVAICMALLMVCALNVALLILIVQ